MRAYDLTETDVLSSLCGRLQIDWGRDPINWAKRGNAADKMPILEIADRIAYEAWRTALGSVQGIYLIADTSTGQLYVGKADGGERILGRWRQYAADGHGGNIALRALGRLDGKHARHFQFSLLRVFGPSTPTTEVDAAESHFKNAVLSRTHGLNRNQAGAPIKRLLDQQLRRKPYRMSVPGKQRAYTWFPRRISRDNDGAQSALLCRDE